MLIFLKIGENIYFMNKEGERCLNRSCDIQLNGISIISLTLWIYAIAAVVTDEGSMLMKLSRLLLLGVFCICLCIKKKLQYNAYILCMGIFCVVAACSANWAINKTYANAMGKTLLINLACMYALFYIIDSKRERIEELLKAFVIAPLFLELRVIATGGLFAFSSVRKAGSINGNTVGVCAAFGLCFAIYFILKGQSKRWFRFLAFANLLVVILSSSRKAILCFIIPLAMIYVFDNKDNIVKNASKIIVVLFVAIIGYYALLHVPFLYSMAGHRIESMIAGMLGTDAVVDSSTSTRLNLIQWGLEWFKERKWLGYGIDNYRFVLHSYHSNWSLAYYAHNNYVELLVDVGLIGTIAYYFNYIKMIVISVTNVRKVTKTELLFIGILVALLIGEYGLVTYYDKYVQVVLVIIWMFIVPLKNEKYKG